MVFSHHAKTVPHRSHRPPQTGKKPEAEGHSDLCSASQQGLTVTGSRRRHGPRSSCVQRRWSGPEQTHLSDLTGPCGGRSQEQTLGAPYSSAALCFQCHSIPWWVSQSLYLQGCSGFENREQCREKGSSFGGKSPRLRVCSLVCCVTLEKAPHLPGLQCTGASPVHTGPASCWRNPVKSELIYGLFPQWESGDIRHVNWASCGTVFAEEKVKGLGGRKSRAKAASFLPENMQALYSAGSSVWGRQTSRTVPGEGQTTEGAADSAGLGSGRHCCSKWSCIILLLAFWIIFKR